jgi:hypothetical protein
MISQNRLFTYAFIFSAAAMVACSGAADPVENDTAEAKSGATGGAPAPSGSTAPSSSGSECPPPPPPPSPPAETCGGPPPVALCMECPGGINGFKQIDGKPTCECCTVPLSACALPADPGPCTAVFMRWAFDTKSGKCQPLQWGGCGGNANNFDSEAACEKACSP